MVITVRSFEVVPGVGIGPGHPLLVVAGPCVVEGREMLVETAGRLREMMEPLGVGFVFKASFDKANRTSLASPRGPGLEKGLEALKAVKEEVNVPILTDIHEPGQAPKVMFVADIIQIPAFLCRQTDLLLAAGRTGRVVNIKKGQFLEPRLMGNAAEKVFSTGNERVILTERGAFFGYGDLVVDMRALPAMRSTGCPVVFDATHSVQKPGGKGGASGGDREMVRPLLRAACAAGVDGIFLETHPEPGKALSDGANMVPLDEMAGLVEEALGFHEMRRKIEGGA